MRRRSVRAGLTVLTSALAVAGVAVFGVDGGHATRNVRLLSGAAWLSSSKVGQVTLLDGSSAEVVAQLQVAPAGNLVDVVQQGSTAYAIDQTAGAIRRVDGATFDLSQPASPIPDASGGLVAFAGTDTVYLLDSRRGVLAFADPRTLVRRGDPIPLAAQLDPGAAALDDAGRLWVIDNSTGDLTLVADGKSSKRRGVARPGRNILTIAGGQPAIVDTTDRTAVVIDSRTAQPRGSLDLDLRPDDTIHVSGSAHAQRLYIVVGRGALNICDLAGDGCGSAIPLNAGSQFGAAVEAADRLFIPDFTTGQVWIIDLDKRHVVAKPTVLGPGARFQLLTRDGKVFYNDDGSERAGVIHLDGGIEKVAKYDPNDPRKGLHAPDSDLGLPPPQQPPPPPTDQPPPSEQPPSPAPGQQPNPPNNPPPNPNTVRPPDRTTQRQSSPANPPSPPPTSDQPPAPTLQIAMSNTNPTVNESVTLRVNNTSGPAPVSAQWTFGDGGSAAGVTTSHQWATARTFQVSVQATMPDGQRATTSASITVAPTPTLRLTVTINNQNGSVSGEGISCRPDCTEEFEAGRQVTLTATPVPQGVFRRWENGCTGAARTCTVTMNQAKTVRAVFDDFLTTNPPLPSTIPTSAPPSTPPTTPGGQGTPVANIAFATRSDPTPRGAILSVIALLGTGLTLAACTLRRRTGIRPPRRRRR